MNAASSREITLFQYICLLFGIQVSVGFLSLPQAMAKAAGTDSWIAIPFAWLITTAAGLVIALVMSKHPDGTLLDLLKRCFGVWIGRLGALFVALYFYYFAYAGIARTVLFAKEWLMPETSQSLIMLLLIVPNYMIARNGLRMLGRYAELVILLSLWIPFAYVLVVKEAHWLNMLPLLKGGWQPLLGTAGSASLAFLGLGAMFIFYPALQNKKHAAIGFVAANTMAMAAYLCITILCIVCYSPNQLAYYNDPMVSLLEMIEFKFVERIEVIFVAAYLFFFSLVWIPPFYIGSYCIGWLIGKPEDPRLPLRISCLALAAAAILYTPTYVEIGAIEDLLTRFGIGFEYIFPFCLLLLLWARDGIRGKKA